MCESLRSSEWKAHGMKVDFCCCMATRAPIAPLFHVPSCWSRLHGGLVNKPGIKNFQWHPWPRIHLSHCELFAAWPKDGDIYSLGFLICKIGSMAREELWGSSLHHTSSPRGPEDLKLIDDNSQNRKDTLNTCTQIHTHTKCLSDLSDMFEPEKNERSWSRLATGNKGQGPI